MSYTIEHIEEERESFGPYCYRILKENEEIAIFWHDYRGDVAGIKITEDGYEEDPPFGRCSEFITGGGPDPLGLSSKATDYLDRLLQDSQKSNKDE